MKKRRYQFQLRLGVHHVKPIATPKEIEKSRVNFIIRDVLQQPLDFSDRKPDVTYHLKPRPTK